jgi:ssDNA-binding Zn-finger/Zn-ribbon topoisomerase 1
MELKPGKHLHISCPECGVGSSMVIRQNGDTLEFFIGCSNYPRCKHSQNLPEHLRLEALGQRSLFDADEDDEDLPF